VRNARDDVAGPGVPSDVMSTDTEVGLSRRAITTDDAPAWAELLAAVEAADGTGEHYDADDLMEELTDPGLDPGRDTIAVFDSAGVMVGYGLVRCGANVRDTDRYQLEGCVRPEHRSRGLGRAIFEHLRDRCVELRALRLPHLPADVPAELHVRVHDCDSAGSLGGAALAERVGMTPLRYWYDMERDLDDLPDRMPLPDGLRMVGYDPALDDAVRRARNEAFADHWGSVQRDESDWRQWFTGTRAFRPADSLLVLDDTRRPAHAADDAGTAVTTTAEVAGLLLSYEYEADTAASGVRQAWIGQLGTRRAWRGRGIATALITAALAGFRDAGYRKVSLGVDTSNPTGALGLYERSGFTVAERWTTFGRPL
jgi:mycothiol synthase